MNEMKIYSNYQKIIANIFYISIVIACLITIGGVVYTIADLIMAEGKLELFQGLNLGLQIAIIGTLFAGLFVLIVIGIGMSKKGRIFLLRTIFRERVLLSKYKNRISIQIITICLLVSVFAIILGIIVAFFYELFIGISFTFLQDFSQGQLVLFIGLIIFMIVGLVIGFFYIWHNGYYLIVSMFFTLEKSPPEEEI
jgi:hypothetical protein